MPARLLVNRCRTGLRARVAQRNLQAPSRPKRASGRTLSPSSAVRHAFHGGALASGGRCARGGSRPASGDSLVAHAGVITDFEATLRMLGCGRRGRPIVGLGPLTVRRPVARPPADGAFRTQACATRANVPQEVIGGSGRAGKGLEDCRQRGADKRQGAEPTMSTGFRIASSVALARHHRRPWGDNMVWIPGGTFRMGSDRHYPEEAPSHRAAVDGFWIESTPVTNRVSSSSSRRPATSQWPKFLRIPRTIPARCRIC